MAGTADGESPVGMKTILCAAALSTMLAGPSRAQAIKLGVLTDLSGQYSDVAG